MNDLSDAQIVEKAKALKRSLDESKVEALIAERDYEELDFLIMSHLLA